MKIKVNVFGWRLEFKFLFQLNKKLQSWFKPHYTANHKNRCVCKTPQWYIHPTLCNFTSFYNHFFKNYSTKQDTKYLLQSRVPSLTHGGLHVNNVSTSKRRQYFYHLKIFFLWMFFFFSFQFHIKFCNLFSFFSV